MFPQILKTVNLAPVIVSASVLRELACKHLEEHWSLKGCAPFTWLVAHRSIVTYIDTPWENDHEKWRTTEVMRSMINEPIISAYAHTVEAWIASLGADKMPDQKERDHWLKFTDEHGVKGLPPHLREDVAMVMAFDRGGGHACSRYLVTDRKGRGPNILGPRADEDGIDSWGGRMGNMFKPRESHSVVIAKAEDALKKATGQ